jgi:hypothetical protein
MVMIMKFIKQTLFVSVLCAASATQAAPILSAGLQDLTVYAKTYISSGAEDGSKQTINGNALTNGYLTIGAGSAVTGNTESNALTTGANASNIGGNAVSATAVTLGAGSTVDGDLTYGTAATYGSGASVAGVVTGPTGVLTLNDESAAVSLAQTALTALGAGSAIAPGNIAASTTFYRGVYTVAGLLTFTANTTITLDAENTDGDFVFNVADYVTFGAGVDVVVVNGTGKNNVFWNTGGYTSIGAKADIVGTVLANTYVSIGANATLKGLGTSCGGAFSATSYVSVGAQATVGGAECSGAQVVPLPAAAWLFGSALIGLVGIGRRNKGQI